MLLPKDQVEQLIQLVADGEPTRSALKQCGNSFQEHFQQRSDRFRAQCMLVYLLQQPDLLKNAERVMAFYLIASRQSWSELQSFPFLHFFLQAACAETTPSSEQAVLQHILDASPSAIEEECAADVIQGHGCRAEADLLTAEELRARYPIKSLPALPVTCSFPTTSTAQQHFVFQDTIAPDNSEPTADDDCGNEHQSTWQQPSLKELTAVLQGFLKTHRRETGPHEDTVQICKQLLQDALRAQLQPEQYKRFLSMLEACPQVVQHIGLVPDQLLALVEHNNMIAVELLLRLLQTGSPTVGTFLEVLVHMDLSVHAMEVVKRLTSVATLPDDFIRLYIKSCMNACEAIEQKNQQNRPVRLVCVFLQSLIRTKIIDVTTMQYELRSFCVKFSRIREAATLFKLLQSLNDQSEAQPGA